MNSCSTDQSIVISQPMCNLLTPAQWFSTPGTCRLRVKNFNPADWVSGACNTCTNAGGSTWDGTFPLFVPDPLNPFYQIAATTGNIGGKTPLFGNNCSCGFLNGVGWFVALSCAGAPPQFIFSSAFVAFGSGPIATYARNQGCIGLPSVTIEAFIP